MQQDKRNSSEIFVWKMLKATIFLLFVEYENCIDDLIHFFIIVWNCRENEFFISLACYFREKLTSGAKKHYEPYK